MQPKWTRKGGQCVCSPPFLCYARPHNFQHGGQLARGKQSLLARSWLNLVNYVTIIFKACQKNLEKLNYISIFLLASTSPYEYFFSFFCGQIVKLFIVLSPQQHISCAQGSKQNKHLQNSKCSIRLNSKFQIRTLLFYVKYMVCFQKSIGNDACITRA